MKALRLHGNRDIRVEDVPEPGHELGDRDVLLRNRRVGICGTDLHEYLDGPLLATTSPHPLTGASLPQILGHEFSGEVIAVGEEVTSVKPGDRVAVMPLFFCRRCPSCLRGRPQTCWRLGAVGLNWPWGGMGELAVVAEQQVAVLPDEVTDVQGAMVEPAAVAVHSVTTSGVKVGDAVLVTGGGPIGQLVALAAIAAGAAGVYLSELNPRRRARANGLGLTELLDPSELDVAAYLRSVCAGGVDIAIECAGNAHAVKACVEAVRIGGVVMQTGLHTRAAGVDLRSVTLRDISIRGANCFEVTSWPRVIGLIASGAMPVERVVTSEVPLEEGVSSGFEALVDPQSDQIKVMLAIDGAR
jgi:(R,R)-butanediol dehydrogenase / meso-butanediol dehydrogenase / diacetyl reductase